MIGNPTAIQPIKEFTMTAMFCVSGKFAEDARKAFFAELSTRLEYMAETLTQETALSDFDEMIQIIQALRQEANAVHVEKLMAKRAAMDEVKF
jgi:hypothetical protein